MITMNPLIESKGNNSDNETENDDLEKDLSNPPPLLPFLPFLPAGPVYTEPKNVIAGMNKCFIYQWSHSAKNKLPANMNTGL